VAHVEARHVKNHAENRVVHRHFGQLAVGGRSFQISCAKESPHSLLLQPALASRRTPFFQEQLEVLPLVVREREGPFAVMTANGKWKTSFSRVSTGLNLREVLMVVSLRRWKEFLAETNRTLGAGVDEIGAFHCFAAGHRPRKTGVLQATEGKSKG